MFLNHHSPQSDTEQGQHTPLRVIGETHLDAIARTHLGDKRKIGIFDASRICRGAFQDGYIIITLLMASLDGFADLAIGSDTGADDHRATESCSITNQIEVHHLKTGNLIDRTIERLEQIDSLAIEGGREALYATIASQIEEFGMPFVGGIGFLVEVVEPFAIP